MNQTIAIHSSELRQLAKLLEESFTALDKHVRSIPADVRMPNAHILMHVQETPEDEMIATLTLCNPDDPAHAHMMPPEGSLEVLMPVSYNDCATVDEVLEALHSTEFRDFLADPVAIWRLLADARVRAWQQSRKGAAA